MKKLILLVTIILMFVAGQAIAAPLLEWQFDLPDQAASIPAGYDIDITAFNGGDGFTTAGYSGGGGYLSTFEGDGETVAGTNAATVFGNAGPVKNINVMVKIAASAFDIDGNFDTPWDEMQLARFNGASGGTSHGGLIINTYNGTNTAEMITSFGWETVGQSSSNLMTWEADTWYHLKWEFRDSIAANPGVIFYRDGGNVGSRSVNTTWDAAGDIFLANHPAADVDAGLEGVMDNFQIAPEPATMMLLGLGGLALLRRRNR